MLLDFSNIYTSDMERDVQTDVNDFLSRMVSRKLKYLKVEYLSFFSIVYPSVSKVIAKRLTSCYPGNVVCCGLASDWVLSSERDYYATR